MQPELTTIEGQAVIFAISSMMAMLVRTLKTAIKKPIKDMFQIIRYQWKHLDKCINLNSVYNQFLNLVPQPVPEIGIGRRELGDISKELP